MSEHLSATLFLRWFDVERAIFDFEFDDRAWKRVADTFSIDRTHQMPISVGLKQDVLKLASAYAFRGDKENFKGAAFVNADLDSHSILLPAPLISMNVLSENLSALASKGLILDFSAFLGPLRGEGEISTYREFTTVSHMRVRAP